MCGLMSLRFGVRLLIAGVLQAAWLDAGSVSIQLWIPVVMI